MAKVVQQDQRTKELQAIAARVKGILMVAEDRLSQLSHRACSHDSDTPDSQRISQAVHEAHHDLTVACDCLIAQCGDLLDGLPDESDVAEI